MYFFFQALNITIKNSAKIFQQPFEKVKNFNFKNLMPTSSHKHISSFRRFGGKGIRYI